MKKFLLFIVPVLITLYIVSCTDPVSNKVAHQPPNTHLSVFSMPGDTITPGATIMKISWWGDSPDGFVVGFKVSFDSINWGYTTKNYSTFIFTIQGQDSTFRIWVAAVDDKGFVDPTPTSNLYPVMNSSPTMVFDAGTDIPDTIYPVATFKFSATDPDGNSTIRNFYWSLNDSLHFQPISPTQTLLTLNKDAGLTGGASYSLYMKCVDNAGAFSPIVRMPRDSSKKFYVKPVTGRVLLVKDMPLSNNELGTLNTFFAAAFDTVQYNSLDIKSNSGALVPKIINPMFIETLKLFKVVVWSGNRGGQTTSDDPNLSLAQNSIPYYIAAGGKVFWTSGIPDNFIGQGQLFNFAPVDSIKSTCYIQFIFPGDTIQSLGNGYPNLNASFFIANTRGIYANINAQNVLKYAYNPGRPYCSTDSYVSVRDNAANPKMVFMVMPIYYLNGSPANAKQFLNRIFIDFGLFN